MTTLRPPDPALLDGAALEALHGRSMLLTQDWTTAEIETLCSLAETLQALDRQGRVPALFPQELFWALFFDQSTRMYSRSNHGRSMEFSRRTLVSSPVCGL